MKILIIIPSLNIGGAERQVISDARLLSEQGNEVHVSYNVAGILEQQLPKKIILHHLNSVNIVSATNKIFKLLRSEKYDLIMAHLFWAHKVAFIPAFFTKTKLFLFEHGLGLWRKWYHIILIRLISKTAIKTITVSNAKKKIKINREKIPAKNIVVIHNSFKMKANTDNNKTSSIVLPKDKFLIGFAGRFHPVKQLSLLIEIALFLKEMTDNFCFILIGDGVERQRIEKLIEDNNLKEYFYLTGFLKNPDTVMEKLHSFILPSQREDFSVALLEASSNSLPCLAFDVGGNKEIIENNETGFIISPFDTKEMAAKIARMIESPEMAKNLGIKAKSKVISNFSEAQRLKNLNILFNENK